jgi:replicative DNA helicase
VKGVPHNWETERSLLGGMLLDSRQIPDLLERVAAEDFARPNHRSLFQLLVDLQNAQGAVDIVSLLDELEKRSDVEELGGASYIAGLPSACPSVDNLQVYAIRVREHAVRRRLLAAAEAIAEEVKEGATDLATLLDGAEKRVFDVAQLSGSRDWHQLSLVIDEQMRVIEERAATPGEVTGVPTGFIDLDKMLSGLHKSDLLVLAARPAMGKTAFALNLGLNAAQKGGVGVGVFSLEMSRQQLATRLLCAQARVDATRVRTGQLDVEDWRRLSEAADTLHKLPIFIDDTPGLTINQLRSKARRLRSECPGLGLLVIDYLQLMQGSGGAKESRENAVSTISRGLKILAKDLGVPVMALSQLNRSLESRTDKRPLPSDLRESGAIEQDADVILFIYRDEVYNPESPDKGLAEIIIAKQRSGPIGKVKLAFLPQFTLFQNYAANSGGADGYY